MRRYKVHSRPASKIFTHVDKLKIRSGYISIFHDQYHKGIIVKA
jgi:hypothetical protein